MSLMETLVIESKATEMTSKEDEEEQIQLESGWQWAPQSWVTKEGDAGFGRQGLLEVRRECAGGSEDYQLKSRTNIQG